MHCGRYNLLAGNLFQIFIFHSDGHTYLYALVCLLPNVPVLPFCISFLCNNAIKHLNTGLGPFAHGENYRLVYKYPVSTM